MKTNLIFAIFLFNFLNIIYSQNCEIIKNEIDPFTKNEIIETNFEVLSYGNLQKEVVRVQGIKIDGTIFLRIYFIYPSPFLLNKDDSISLLTENDIVIEFNLKESIVSNINSSNLVTSSYIRQNFYINEEILNILTKNNIKKIRIETNNGYVNHDVRKKRMGNLAKVLKCISD